MKKNIMLPAMLIIIIAIFFCCGNKQESRLLNFDIDPLGKIILYSFKENGRTSLYMKTIGGDKKVFFTDLHYSFYNPRFASNGKKLTFVGQNIDTSKSSIWISNLKGDSIVKIYENDNNIIEAISSLDNNKVYFTKAMEYTSYSPLAPKSSHNFDIYEYNIKSKQVHKISNINGYGLYDITDFDENRLLLTLKGKNSGIFFCDKKSQSNLKKIVTLNDTLRNSSAYANPVLLDNGNLICSSYYQLVKINLKTNTEKRILESNGYEFEVIRYCKNLAQIFYKKNDDTNNIQVIDSVGNKVKTIPIE